MAELEEDTNQNILNYNEDDPEPIILFETKDFFFSKETDLEKVLKGNPWTFINSWLLLKKWDRKEEPEFRESELKVKIWEVKNCHDEAACGKTTMDEKNGINRSKNLGPWMKAEERGYQINTKMDRSPKEDNSNTTNKEQLHKRFNEMLMKKMADLSVMEPQCSVMGKDSSQAPVLESQETSSEKDLGCTNKKGTNLHLQLNNNEQTNTNEEGTNTISRNMYINRKTAENNAKPQQPEMEEATHEEREEGNAKALNASTNTSKKAKPKIDVKKWKRQARDVATATSNDKEHTWIQVPKRKVGVTETMEIDEQRSKLMKGTPSHDFPTVELMISPADINENHKFELSRAWEPLGSSSSKQAHKGERS
ncbi:hypothetical protein PIB30_078774 [Stylosanthes scabra]|uniref:DUF4283 domain-containing protein n=1 Tax=Stylosanthes scabra TaxID=79078 RepID=A0ABU6QR39_9FABA|nr:hypothetical protein [Stylosanthes scabra]